ncbi:hypothetical protein DCC61_02970 [Candidatus Microgenomates bacterium]|nr:MAG: hypothetical protein DCC61_02970 [Candidatus Microgenomates bacterium]
MAWEGQDSRLNPLLVAEKLRQSAAVSPTTSKGKSIGMAREVAKLLGPLEQKWGGRAEPRESDPEYDEWNFFEEMKLWLQGDEEGILPIEFEMGEKSLTLGELAKMRMVVRERVSALFDPENNKKPYMLANKSKLERLGGKALAKLGVFQASLDNLKNSDLIVLALERERVSELTNACEDTRRFLHKSLALDAGETEAEWSAKWERVVEGSGQDLDGDKRAKRKLRALELYRMVSTPKAEEMARAIEDDTLRLASAHNFYLLVEKMKNDSEQPVDLEAIKSEVERVREKENPRLNDVLSLTRSVGKVSRYIASHFPHDHASLLGQAIIKGQAVCAGKTLMMAMILRELGVEAEIENVAVLNNNDFEGGHVCVGYRVGEYRVEMELNCRTENKTQEEMSGCWVNVLQKSSERMQYPDKETISRTSGKQYLLQEDGEVSEWKCVWGKAPHKVVSLGEVGENLIDHNNLAILLRDPRFLEMYEGDPEKQNALLLEAERLYRKAIEQNPNSILFKKNFYVLFYEHLDDLIEHRRDIEGKRALYQEAIELGNWSIVENFWPDYTNNIKKLIASWEAKLAEIEVAQVR